MSYNDNFEEDMYDEEENASTQEVAGGIDHQGHLQADDMWGVQHGVFDISYTGSLEQFQNGTATTRWKLGSNMTHHLQHNMALRNRDKATAEDLEGDLGKAIILDAQVVEQQNELPVKMGINISHLVPRVFCQSAFNWTLNPNTQTQAVGERAGHIMQPTNIFARWMFEKLSRMDVAELKRQIQLDQETVDGSVPYRTDGIAWEILSRNVEDDLQRAPHEQLFPGFHDEFFALQDDIATSRRPVRLVEIPSQVAKSMYKALEPELKKLEQAYVDLREVNADLKRVDGEPFDSMMGLVGEAYGQNADSKDELNAYTKTAVRHVGIKLRLAWVCRK